MIDDAFDGVLIIHTPDHPADLNFTKSGLTDIMCNVPLTPTELTTDEQTKETRQKLKNALRQSFSKFASSLNNSYKRSNVCLSRLDNKLHVFFSLKNQRKDYHKNNRNQI